MKNEGKVTTMYLKQPYLQDSVYDNDTSVPKTRYINFLKEQYNATITKEFKFVKDFKCIVGEKSEDDHLNIHY